MREVVDLRVLELRHQGRESVLSLPSPRTPVEEPLGQDADVDRLRRRDQVLHALEVARRLRRLRRPVSRHA